MTQDIDLVADLKPEHVQPFVDAVQKDYYVNKQTVADAVARRSCFNLIHYNSIFKIDIFAVKNRDYDRQAMDRCRKLPLIAEDPETVFSVAAAGRCDSWRSSNGIDWATKSQRNNGAIL